jgi:hypothetical protein
MNRKIISLCLGAALLAPCLVAAQGTVAPAVAATDTGTVIFFREKKMIGAAIRYKVRENEVELCKLGSGTFCTVKVPAGSHKYDVHTEAGDSLTLDVKPGQTYYVVGAISMGAFAGHPKLTLTDQSTFDGMKGKLKDNTGKDLKTGDDK